MTLRILGISGNVTRPSRTAVVVRGLTERIAGLSGGTVEVIKMAQVAPHILSALERSSLGEAGRAIIGKVETADLLVVGSPVYRASYTGALKHLFDLVDHRALAGRPAIVAATGGSPLHGLVTEHQLRPLLAFFGALVLPTTLYAVESDFEDYRLSSSAVAARSERAAREAVPFLNGAAPAALVSPVPAVAGR